MERRDRTGRAGALDRVLNERWPHHHTLGLSCRPAVVLTAVLTGLDTVLLPVQPDLPLAVALAAVEGAAL